MNYHHLTIEERSCIRKYYVDGLSYREIARLIGRNVSTVSREIRRNCTHMYDIPTYYPHTAQKKYLLRRSYCHRGMFHSQEVIEYIAGQDNYLRPGSRICQLAQNRRTAALRGLFCRPLLCMAERHRGNSTPRAETFPVSLPPR